MQGIKSEFGPVLLHVLKSPSSAAALAGVSDLEGEKSKGPTKEPKGWQERGQKAVWHSR